jgi:hypothetical protein
MPVAGGGRAGCLLAAGIAFSSEKGLQRNQRLRYQLTF